MTFGEKMPKRKYSPEYLKCGFSFIEDKQGQKPQCVICNEVLAHASMKPSKLMRHLQTKHTAYKDKPVEFFQRRLHELKASKKCLTASCSKQEQALRASYHVAFRIAKAKKPHTIAEELILPAAMDMVREVLDGAAADKLKTIPLSNDTIARRIKDMSDNIKQQTTARVQTSPYFALQMDESTDIANHAILLVYVRHVWDGDLQEQFLCSRELPTTTKAEDIFNSVDLYLSSMGLSWEYCVGITTDGAASMTGKHSGVVKQILTRAPNATWNHCFLHREALAAKNMVPDLNEALQDVIKVVNHIKRSAKSSRCFSNLCKDLGSEHMQVLYHSEVRWLSRGKVLSRFYELKTEIATFLSENNSVYAELFDNNTWLALVAYLADIFEHLNALNVSMQGKGHNIFEQSDKVVAFKKKITLWVNNLSKDRLDMFPNVRQEVQQLDTTAKNYLKKTIKEHLSKLQARFDDYFPERHGDNSNAWIRDPFSVNMESVMLPSNEEHQLVELSCDQTLKKRFGDPSALSSVAAMRRCYAYPSLLQFITGNVVQKPTSRIESLLPADRRQKAETPLFTS
ncbi:protein FAM200B-like [Astyanax mexicanus]|uniref:protein FAM200B-like n=1 Tax=Astyanax mexicanus TaxID=7994 RepID=UPI0020CAF737|nr:protein FAM200B-like [Astyanax mexicanus]